MSVTFGFYNSVDGDRRYDAVLVSKLFDGLINDGIYSTRGTQMMVRPNTGLTVIVGEGRAWFNHTWTLIDAELILELDTADVSYGRYDVIVLEVDSSEGVRANSIKIIKGTAQVGPEIPSWTNTETLSKYPLAVIYVPAGSTEIIYDQITNKVGTSACPFVTGVLTSFNIDALVAQWQSEFDIWLGSELMSYTVWFNARAEEWLAWYGGQQEDFEAWLVSIGSDWTEWSSERQDAFDLWWASFVDNLTTEQATNLQLEIDAINAKVLTADRTYYVRLTDGNDSNNGLANTVGGAFLTIQKAVDVACALDLGPHNITISVSYTGTITDDIRLKPYKGTGTIRIYGSVLHPESSKIVCSTSGKNGFNGVNCGHWIIDGLSVNITSGSGIVAEGNSCIDINNVFFYNCYDSHIKAIKNAVINVIGNCKIIGQANHHMYAESGGVIYNNQFNHVIDNIGSWYFAAGFAAASSGGGIYSFGCTWSNPTYIIGPKYRLELLSWCNTVGGGANYFPGNSVGVVYGGSQYA